MTKFFNRNQLLKATDEEIEHFFAETTFEAILPKTFRTILIETIDRIQGMTVDYAIIDSREFDINMINQL